MLDAYKVCHGVKLVAVSKMKVILSAA